MNKRKPEVLAPAGNLENLKTAIDCGADAVYVGGNKLNLNVFSDSFSNEEMLEGVKYCHDRNRKIYVTLNTFVRNSDLKDAEKYIRLLKEIEVDAVIIADSSLISIINKVAPKIEIHLSTQANIVNSVSAKFWYENGAKRLILPRELTLKQIKVIRENLPVECEIEVFVHGSTCIAYSGRCLVSNYTHGRNASIDYSSIKTRNKYYLVEETRKGKYYPVVEDKHGTYIMNYKDLCMIKHIPELVESGIDSFKIEGRRKSNLYVESVVKAYRESIDTYYKDVDNYEFKEEWMDILRKVSDKEYDTGVYFGINEK